MVRHETVCELRDGWHAAVWDNAVTGFGVRVRPTGAKSYVVVYRADLLIADDVGPGKTVEAGLVARELLLRRRIDFIVITAPPAMTTQWKDELETVSGSA